MKIRIALAEDKPFLATSIQEKLALFDDDIEFRFWANNGKVMLEKLAENHAIDAILMDIEMPEMDGIEATAEIVAQYPHIKIIMLTVFDDEQRIFNAIQAGAMGYLLKDEPPQKLHESIKMIMDGGAPMSPTIAAKSLKLLRNPSRAESETTGENFNLGKREIE